MNKNKQLLLALSISALGACVLNPPIEFEKGTNLAPLELADHVFQRRQLANGLTAIAVRDEEKSVSIFIAVAAGKRQETEATTGLAHLTEHAMYTGTENTGPGEHDRHVRGLGGQSNAFTREDYTLYYDHKIPIGSLQEVLEMEADRLSNLDFPSEAVHFEREQLRKEEANTWQPSQVLDERLEQAVYTLHPYKAGVLSKEGHTRGPFLRVAQIKDFYKTWYQPQHVAVVVAGDIDPQQALDDIEQAFGPLSNGAPPPPISQEPDISTARNVVLESTLSRDRLEWVWLTPAMGDPDRPALYVLADILSRRSSASGKPLTIGMGNRVDRELFRIIVTDTDDGTEISEVIQTLLREEITQDELDEIKTRLSRQYSNQALRARPYFSLAASVGVYAALGQLDSLQSYEKAITDLNSDDILAAARNYLAADKRVSVLFKGTGIMDDPLPEDSLQLRRVAAEAMQQGNLERSANAYTALLKLGPDRMNTVIYLASRGQVRMQQRDYAAAIEDFESALQIVDYPDVRNLLEEVQALKAGLNIPPEARPSDHRDQYENGKHGSQLNESQEQGLMKQLGHTRQQLEDWRELHFKQPIKPEFVEPEDNDLAGWYEHDKRRLVVVKGRSEEFSRGALLHELHHALQDQNWNLSKLQKQARTTDQARAIRSLIEGEAMLAVADIMHYDFEQHMILPEHGELDRDRFEKIFNYGHGLRFVRNLRQQGGWDAINEIWRKPPLSTAEIYHPERYPLKLAADLNTELEEGDVLKDTRLGEFELRWLLASTEDTRPLTDSIASSLVNDRWRLVQHGFFDKREHWELGFSDKSAATLFMTDAMAAVIHGGWQAKQNNSVVHLWRKAENEDWNL